MSIRERLYPKASEESILIRHCGDARYVWNLGLEQRGYWRRGMSSISVYDQMRSLTEGRQRTWLGAGSAVVQQQALFDLDRAFRNWWKNPTHFKRPTWRKVGIHEGFHIRDLSVRRINRRWGEVQVPKCGWVRFRITRQWTDITAGTSARVTLDRSGRWHVSFTTPPPVFEREPTGARVGLDMGIAASVTTSDGTHLKMPSLLTSGEAQRKRRLQRKLSRQEKGSKHRKRTKHQIACLWVKEVNRRRDWIEKTTTDLVRDYDFISIENLKIRNMVHSAKGTIDAPGKGVRQKAGLNRSIHSQAWGKFRQRLTDKATNAIDLDGTSRLVTIIAINPAYTSQCCSKCGHTTSKNRENQATFRCLSCNYSSNADVNAANNILAAGLAVTGRGGTSQAKSEMMKHSDPMKRQPINNLSLTG